VRRRWKSAPQHGKLKAFSDRRINLCRYRSKVGERNFLSEPLRRGFKHVDHVKLRADGEALEVPHNIVAFGDALAGKYWLARSGNGTRAP